MILFKKIRFKNILSYGNYWTELKLNQDDITVIIGPNGAGKSTFLDCLSFVLFGKPFRKINKPQIVNSITKKNCVVEVEFNSYGHEYKVIRGLKPVIFEIWKDDSLMPPPAGTGNDQDVLEQEILRCNHKTFNQLVVLGAANYIPFFDMVMLDRRKFTESIFDLEYISVMNFILKQDMTKLDDEIKELEAVKYNIEYSKKVVSDSLNIVWQDKIDEISNLINVTTERLDSYEDNLKKYEDEIIFIDQEKFNTLNINLSEIEKQIQFSYSRIDELKRKIDSISLRKNQSCPTCNHCLTEEEFDQILNIEKDTILKFENVLLGLSEKRNILQTELDVFDHQISHNENIKTKITETKHYISECHKSIGSFNKELVLIAEKKTQDNIIVDEEEYQKVNKKLDNLMKNKEKMMIILNLLRDDGVKASILKQNIDLINELVNGYLLDMEFFCSFNLNEEFEEVIKSRYRDEFSYHSFSQGERLRITLALLLTWREISRRRSSIDTNLLIFDEILDSSLDQEGVNLFLDLIRKILVDRNVFIISHNNSAIDRINKVINVTKYEGFSRYEE